MSVVSLSLSLSQIKPTFKVEKMINILNDVEVEICCSRKYLSLNLYFQLD